MKLVILGAGGILGQHMRLLQPSNISTSYYRTIPWNFYKSVNLYVDSDVYKMLDMEKPDIVLNLAGKNDVDTVEQFPDKFHKLNVTAPRLVAYWCKQNGAHMIQVSTQGVFSGENPPYSPESVPNPITHYGRQKAKAELLVREINPEALVARITFVLGVRPFPEIGRINPLELMFSQKNQKQVNDRWFSPTFASDTASQLWKLVKDFPSGATVHIGQPIRVSRWDIACAVYHDLHLPLKDRPHIEPVSHDYWSGLASRPRDTTWKFGSMYDQTYIENIQQAYNEWIKR